MPRLENWSVVKTSDSEGEQVILGTVYDDEFHRFEDGDEIYTSPIKILDLANNVVHTHNTMYKLGVMSTQYKKWLKEQGTQQNDNQDQEILLQ